mmetsp:Transcript_20946/g.31254  ORF Transcript_20946/g.31254 Transcript_20946/m.31254 type:complete len:104 (+) Transcript_20946:1284-1595(+)
MKKMSENERKLALNPNKDLFTKFEVKWKKELVCFRWRKIEISQKEMQAVSKKNTGVALSQKRGKDCWLSTQANSKDFCLRTLSLITKKFKYWKERRQIENDFC